MYTPKEKMEKARAVVKTFEETGHDYEKTAEAHWFKDIGSVYRFLRHAKYKFPERTRNKLGQYGPLKSKK